MRALAGQGQRGGVSRRERSPKGKHGGIKGPETLRYAKGMLGKARYPICNP